MALEDLSKEELIALVTKTRDELKRMRVQMLDTLDKLDAMLLTGQLTERQIAIEVITEVKQQARNGDFSGGSGKIHAIKLYRNRTACGLMEAKQMIVDSGLWDEVS